MGDQGWQDVRQRAEGGFLVEVTDIGPQTFAMKPELLPLFVIKGLGQRSTRREHIVRGVDGELYVAIHTHVLESQPLKVAHAAEPNVVRQVDDEGVPAVAANRNTHVDWAYHDDHPLEAIGARIYRHSAGSQTGWS